MNYQPVIGLEIHAQVSSKSKMFCSCDNDSFNKEPNSNVCPVCMGFPGMLPVINQQAVEKGIKASLALNCRINNFSRFDRKNYFYPDLPKGFQISQYDQPLAGKGEIMIAVDGKEKKIGITRLHLEDDAGKLTHVAGGTLCDYNRSGTPLMEIVSEPDIASPQQAVAYAREIQKILRTVDASDCDMEKGMMRFDINVSLKKPADKKLGVKAEVKNLNSFRALEKALEYEIKRQAEMLNKGEKIIQETRGFDAEKEITFSQRTKEEAQDYRYFPEPDLPPLNLEDATIEKLKKQLPELPSQKALRYEKKLHLAPQDIEVLLDNPALADFFEQVQRENKLPEKSASWITNVLLARLNAEKIPLKQLKFTPAQLARLILLVEQGKISNLSAKEDVFPIMWDRGRDPEKIIEEKGLSQLSDDSLLEEICDTIIKSNPGPVQDFRDGTQKALGFLIGQAMKESKGKANPQKLNKIFLKKLKNL